MPLESWRGLDSYFVITRMRGMFDGEKAEEEFYYKTL